VPDSAPEPGPPAGTADGEPPRALRIAAILVLIEAGALTVAALALLIKTATGHPAGVGRALGVAGFALTGAIVLALCARGLLRLRPSARAPIMIIELLALPVTFSLGFQAGRAQIGVPILVVALGVLGLLLSPQARAALDRAL
jgi:hypothetical protein